MPTTTRNQSPRASTPARAYGSPICLDHEVYSRMLGSEEEQRAEAELLARTADHDAEVLGEFLKDFGLKGL